MYYYTASVYNNTTVSLRVYRCDNTEMDTNHELHRTTKEMVKL